MADYRCLLTVKIGGEFHAPGDIIDLDSEDDIEKLMAARAVAPYSTKNEKASADMERRQKIEDVLRGMDADDSSNFTADGKPTLDYLEQLLTFRITAEERDDAWAARS